MILFKCHHELIENFAYLCLLVKPFVPASELSPKPTPPIASPPIGVSSLGVTFSAALMTFAHRLRETGTLGNLELNEPY